MKTYLLIRLVSISAATALFVGCSCNKHCSGPMASYGTPLRDVHFAFDSAKLTPTAKQTLREDFDHLGLGEASAATKIILEGRADERGDSSYNEQLSQRRVDAVRRYLISLGAKNAQFEPRKLGESEPLRSGSNPSAWAMNRSVRVVAR